MNKKKLLFLALYCVQATFAAKENSQKALDIVRHRNVQYIEFIFSDFLGQLKSVLRPFNFLEKDLENGIFVDGSSIPGCNRITESDMLLMPDNDTVRVTPWSRDQGKIALVMCTMHKSAEEPYSNDPRFILQKVTQEAREAGFIFNVGTELEFFIFKKNDGSALVPFDNGQYIEAMFDFSTPDMQTGMLHAFRSFGLDPEKMHHEVAPGQYEIVLKYDDALTMADKVTLAKYVLKGLGNLNNLTISFMPKPLFGKNGSGLHMHFSLVDAQTQENVFYDAQNAYYLSPLAQSFIAGVLHHAQAMALAFNPTVNSYKRLVPGYEAPNIICCGTKNRSALIRIPQINADQAQAARAEIRCPDPSCNPYLAFALLLKAGLDGIKRNLKLDAMIHENLFELTPQEIINRGIKMLPGSLDEAIDKFEQSSFIQETLGESFVAIYVQEKRKEAAAYRTAVTDWEIKHYL
ncbi:MAG: type I glutamate--ammonia ligase [Candidatus Babeliales bacterium]